MEENNKQEPPSSFTNDLFGATDSPPNSAYNGVFSSIFAAPSSVAAKNYSTSTFNGNDHKLDTGVQGDMTKDKEGESNFRSSKERNSIFQAKPVPSPLSSSLYYGGKEDMYVRSSSPRTSEPDADNKKNGVDDSSGTNSTGASRGNWWEGSLYY